MGIAWGTGFTLFTPQLDDYEAWGNRLKEDYEAVLQMVELYKSQDPKPADSFPAYTMLLQEQGILSEEQRIEIDSIEMMFDLLEHKDAFHLTIQAKMPPEIKLDGRGLRVDLLAWSPFGVLPRIVVECDGFEYHKNKEQFINDRKRDRLLKSHGYDVVRFSGSEIYADPLVPAKELLDYLAEVANRPLVIDEEE